MSTSDSARTLDQQGTRYEPTPGPYQRSCIRAGIRSGEVQSNKEEGEDESNEEAEEDGEEGDSLKEKLKEEEGDEEQKVLKTKIVVPKRDLIKTKNSRSH